MKDYKGEYKDFLKSNYWATVRVEILKRDKNKCSHCNTTINLQVHHITYKNHFNELNNLNDLITLCKKCHKKEHDFIENPSSYYDPFSSYEGMIEYEIERLWEKDEYWFNQNNN